MRCLRLPQIGSGNLPLRLSNGRPQCPHVKVGSRIAVSLAGTSTLACQRCTRHHQTVAPIAVCQQPIVANAMKATWRGWFPSRAPATQAVPRVKACISAASRSRWTT